MQVFHRPQEADDYEIEETLLSSVRKGKHHLLTKTLWNTHPESMAVYHVINFTIAPDGSRENFNSYQFNDVIVALKCYRGKLELVP